jgi:hypothetical protein
MRTLLLLSFALLASPTSADAQDQLAQLRMLTKGHVYRGSTYADRILYKRETVRGVEFEQSKGWLGIRIDDVDETAPVTIIVPLREAAWPASPAAVIRFSCNASSSCIVTTSESFAQAVQKLAAGQGGALKFSDRRSSFAFGCAADKCAAIKQAIDQLASLPAAPRTGAAPGASGVQPPQSRQASPQTFTPAEIVARINDLSARLEYVAPDGTRVLSYRYATVFDTRRMQLIVTRDIQSFVSSNPGASRTTDRTTIPLGHVAAASFPDRVHKPRQWTFDVHEVGFVCDERKACIQAAARDARAEYQGFKYECDAAKCPALRQALGQLIVAAKAAPPAPASVRR